MKFKVRKSRGQYWLEGRTEAHETLVYSEAEFVRSGICSSLLACTYVSKGKKQVFTYRTADGVPFRKAAKTCDNDILMRACLRSFLDVAHDIERNGLSMGRACFEEECVFYDCSAQRLRFAYAPVMGKTAGDADVMRLFAGLLKHIVCVADDARVQWASALDYFQRNTVFSWIQYESFLASLGLVDAGGADAARQEDGPVDDAVFFVPDVRSRPYDFVSKAHVAESEGVAGDKTAAVFETRGTGHVRGHAQGASRWRFVRSSDKATWILRDGASRVGRSAEADVSIPDVPQISATHAVITFADGCCSIADAGSTFGTFVNGRRLAPGEQCALQEGDCVMLADIPFVVVVL